MSEQYIVRYLSPSEGVEMESDHTLLAYQIFLYDNIVPTPYQSILSSIVYTTHLVEHFPSHGEHA